MLKQISTSLILLLVLASSLNGAQGREWVKVAPLGGGFSVLMPAKPEESVQPGDTITIHAFSVTTDNSLYFVAFGDYSPATHFKLDEELVANRDNFLKGVNAKLTTSRTIITDGRSGLDFTGESDQASFKSREYISGTRFHQIVVAMFKGKDDTENSNKFFASFEFTGSETRPKP